MTMMTRFGTLLSGPADAFARAAGHFEAQPVDLDTTAQTPHPYSGRQTTLARSATVQGTGTFFGRAVRTLTVEPHGEEGWWMDRTDLPEDLPTRVSVRNVWTTGQVVSNIVLRSGAPHNYVRMVEHIVALKLGLGLDRVMIRLDSGDPPLFSRGSLDLVEAVEGAGIVETDSPARWLTVREPVCICHPQGAFVALAPCPGPAPRLRIDAAIDFKTAIGRQRIRFDLDTPRFREGSVARTNTSAAKKLYCQTIGKVFADIRNLGYTRENILIAGRRRYHNEPRLVHEGRSLEAAWHRAVLDLLAALALVEEGRFCGDVCSWRAGHALDVKLVTLLYLNNLLVPFVPKASSCSQRA